jgi:Uma2 family endonuclease
MLGACMSLPQQKDKECFSYADYLAWPDEEHWELIDGIPYAMSPAPAKRHQDISQRLERQIDNYLTGKPCSMYHAPFDVRLSEQSTVSDNYIDTVVQPDILVVCDKAKLDERGCNGAPDLIIEILSSSSAAHDLKVKFELYQRYGVKEYWIIHPAEQTLLVYKLAADTCYGAAERYAGDDMVPVPLLGELVVDLKNVFAE